MSESPPALTSLAPPPSQATLQPGINMSANSPNLPGSLGPSTSSPPPSSATLPGHGPIATPPNLAGPHGPLPPGGPFMPPLGPESAFYPLPVREEKEEKKIFYLHILSCY